ncbi:uncharacterized protein TrAFT101_009811 [Trichoderma asperellum]|uniref:Uncharacterized protein n=1 Tax=Trichoderma asperellum (strain ATCC 204424 / CBS 433.97 / NBRC 101777) TaxID=1042311 RepID=A0A2T3Z9X1_TRIA4|nr:hypothetical protein M441DRAFT_79694 [Trichoderma asperellum CBS 433.97]PTB41580.1 hypothetical protein M441DRAFT_79694 [Trichoderma asperellum CBS 433.97]UKZ94960.1 hypothetical protein TrAFT101_009811 [Trichoderma asperellum]
MRRILLTSGQVSMLATATMIMLCTSALFLSGYAIQQRTLRDLRAAIRPRQSPKAHLPEEFRGALADIEESELIVLETEGQRWSREARSMGPQARVSDAEIQVEETPVEPESESKPELKAEQKEEGQKEAPAAIPDGEPTKKQLEMLEKIQQTVADKSWAVENPDPLSKNKAPISRAQRRKMIKDEILRLSQSDKPVYYQRRLW